MIKVYHLLIIFAISGLVLFGCGAQSNPVESQMVGLDGGTNLAKAFVSKTNITFPFPEPPGFPGNPNPSFIPCANGGAGEFVLSSGTVHGVMTLVQDGNNGFHLQFNYHSQGITGIGQTTGDTYQSPGGERGTIYDRFTGFPHIETIVVAIKFIGPGPDNNFSVHLNGHVIINANGEMTSAIEHITVDCN